LLGFDSDGATAFLLVVVKAGATKGAARTEKPILSSHVFNLWLIHHHFEVDFAQWAAIRLYRWV